MLLAAGNGMSLGKKEHKIDVGTKFERHVLLEKWRDFFMTLRALLISNEKNGSE